MGLLSFLFAGNPPSGSVERMSLRRFYNEVNTPLSDYTVIDLETSGLDACTSEILEIGAIRYRNHNPVDRFHSYVRPTSAIPKAASDVNHITWRKVSSAPPLQEIVPSFFDFLGEDLLIGYNIGFDIKFIQTRTQIDIQNPAFDVLPFARKMLPGHENYRLDELRSTLSLSGHPHSALGDCETTAQVYLIALNSTAYLQYKREIEKELEEMQKLRAEREERNRIKKEKDALAKASMPKAKELHELSASMVGSPEDYLLKAKMELEKLGVNESFIVRSAPGFGALCLSNGSPFFGIKMNGLLRYVILNVPVEHVNCKFVYGPTISSEFYDGVRIYISTPEEIVELSFLIQLAYKNTLPQ